MYSLKNTHALFFGGTLFCQSTYISILPVLLKSSFGLLLTSSKVQYNSIKTRFSNLKIPKWSIKSNCITSRIWSRGSCKTLLRFHSELERITLLTQLPNQLSILQCLLVDTVAVFPTRFAPYWTLCCVICDI